MSLELAPIAAAMNVAAVSRTIAASKRAARAGGGSAPSSRSATAAYANAAPTRTSDEMPTKRDSSPSENADTKRVSPAIVPSPPAPTHKNASASGATGSLRPVVIRD